MKRLDFGIEGLRRSIRAAVVKIIEDSSVVVLDGTGYRIRSFETSLSDFFMPFSEPS